MFQTVLLLLCYWGIVQAQSPFLPLSVDHALYRADSGKVYLEIYLSFYQKHLKYVSHQSGYLSQYVAMAEIRQNDSTVATISKPRHSIIDSLRQISPSRQFLNTFVFKIPQDKYQIRVTVLDVNTSKKGEYLLECHPSSFTGDSLMMSDVQLASEIRRDSTRGEFTKNSFRVIPNPGRTYTIKMPVVYFYTEVYNFQVPQNGNGRYRVHCRIEDKNRHVIRDYPEKWYEKPGESAVVIGGYNIIALPAGRYFLNIEIMDEQSQKVIHRSSRFILDKSDSRHTARVDSITTERDNAPAQEDYARMGEGAMNLEFQAARYIATREQQKIFASLDATGKRQFLADFWKQLDTVPETPVNEFRRDYLARVQYANSHFGTMRQAGWKTDRGRILLTYGRPDEIDRHIMEEDKKPYEIWHYYDLEGGVIFVFADISGFGTFELFHSTFSKEVFQPDWRRLIQQKTGRGFDFNQP